MLALLYLEEQTCRCGGFIPETTAPENEGRYRPKPPIRCHRCDALNAAMEADASERGRQDPAVVLFPIEKV